MIEGIFFRIEGRVCVANALSSLPLPCSVASALRTGLRLLLERDLTTLCQGSGHRQMLPAPFHSAKMQASLLHETLLPQLSSHQTFSPSLAPPEC